MSPPVFLDANVPIYAAGREHPLKAPCVRVLELAAERPYDFVTDAEVLQELLHRYLAQRLWPAGRAVVRTNRFTACRQVNEARPLLSPRDSSTKHQITVYPQHASMLRLQPLSKLPGPAKPY